MTEDFSITSDYWRKLLAIDTKEDPKEVLKKFNYPHKRLRPLFYSLLGLVTRSYWPLKVTGLSNIPKDPPYIIAPNHSSSMDYAMVACAMGEKREELYVLATKHFYDLPPARFFMKIAGNVERIDTVDDFFPALRAAARILKAGRSIYINPEGTRSVTGELLPFRPGVGMLAVELNVPLVPVLIKGTHECMPPGRVLPGPGRVEVHFGEPIVMDQYRPKLEEQNAYYVYKEVTDELKNRIIALKERKL